MSDESSNVLSLEDFAKNYAEEHKLDLEKAEAEVLRNGVYKEYLNSQREITVKIKNGEKTCEDCGSTEQVHSYYCGEFGCGKGSWCRKNKYKLCLDCAAEHQK